MINAIVSFFLAATASLFSPVGGQCFDVCYYDIETQEHICEERCLEW